MEYNIGFYIFWVLISLLVSGAMYFISREHGSDRIFATLICVAVLTPVVLLGAFEITYKYESYPIPYEDYHVFKTDRVAILAYKDTVFHWTDGFYLNSLDDTTKVQLMREESFNIFGDKTYSDIEVIEKR